MVEFFSIELLFLVVAVSFLIIGTPLYIVLFAFSGVLFLVEGIPLLTMVVSFQKLQSQEFISAIPLFTFAGYVLSRSGGPERILAVANTTFAFIPGATSASVILLMALFTSLTGASGVSILALGSLMYPLLKKSTESDTFSHGVITASGSIGLLFVPSLPVIIYSIVANQNVNNFNQVDIDELFRRALVPSFLLIGFFIAYSFFQERRVQKRLIGKGGERKKQVFNWKRVASAFYAARWELPLPFLVYGGIYSGFFTVLEASIVTAFYTFFIAFVVHRELSFSDHFVEVTVSSLKLAGGVFIIMASAFVLTNYFVQQEIPEKVFHAVSPYLTTKIAFLLAVNVLLLIAGCLLDIFSAILIMLPLVIPMAERYGIDPYHFAILFLVNLEIGYLTPPVGLNLFIASYRFKKPITYLYRSTAPFLILLLVGLGLFTFFPELSMVGAKKSAISSSTHGEDGAGGKEIAFKKIREIELVRVARRDGLSVEAFFSFSVDASIDFSKKRFFAVYLDEATDDKDFLLDYGEEVSFEPGLDGRAEKMLFSIVLESVLGERKEYSISVLFENALGVRSTLSKPTFFKVE